LNIENQHKSVNNCDVQYSETGYILSASDAVKN